MPQRKYPLDIDPPDNDGSLLPVPTNNKLSKAQQKIKDQTQNELFAIQAMQVKQQVGTRVLQRMHRDLNQIYRETQEDIIQDTKDIIDNDGRDVQEQFNEAQLKRMTNQMLHLTDSAAHRIAESMNHTIVPEEEEEQPGLFGRLFGKK